MLKTISVDYEQALRCSHNLQVVTSIVNQAPWSKHAVLYCSATWTRQMCYAVISLTRQLALPCSMKSMTMHMLACRGYVSIAACAQPIVKMKDRLLAPPTCTVSRPCPSFVGICPAQSMFKALSGIIYVNSSSCDRPCTCCFPPEAAT